VTDPGDIWVIAGLAWLGRADEARTAAASNLLALRRRGMVGMLPRLLRMLATFDLDEDRWADAAAEAEEGLEWCAELGQSGHRPELLALLATVNAWRGDDAACEQLSAEAVAEAEAHDTKWATLIASRARGLLALGRARYGQAAAIFAPIVDLPLSRGLRGPTLASLPDLVEALERVGLHEEAKERTAEFERRLTGTTDPRASPLTFRCRALTDLGPSAGQRYEQALEAHTNDRDAFVSARTKLLYGEWLRRSGYRLQARRQLEAALEVFETHGAAPWAARTRRELRASGMTMRPPRLSGTELTPAELRVAVLAAAGMPTRELCTQLFLSPKTIETHLGHIYRKLGVRNRAELAQRLPQE
jgi:DNA-binding CsgD family transcriptional regulator